MDKLITLLRRHHMTIATIESFTGGLLADAWIRHPGISDIYRQGLVLYHLENKANWLKLSPVTLEKEGLVSEKLISRLIHEGLHQGLGKIILATTGNAGPKAQPGSRVGEVYLGVGDQQHKLIQKFNFVGDRDSIRNQGVQAIIHLLETFLSTYY